MDTTKVIDVSEKLTNIQALVDSIRTSTDAPRIFETVALEADDLTAFWIAFVAMIAGILAAVFSYLGFWYQRKTMFNTDKISMIVQKSMFRDITRHLYRNFICTLAMSDKYESVQKKSLSILRHEAGERESISLNSSEYYETAI